MAPGVGWAACTTAAVGAVGMRAWERIDEQGFMDSLAWNIADSILTMATLGLGGAFSTLASQVKGFSPGLEWAARLIPAGYDAAISFAEWCAEQTRLKD
ncbi:MAG: hypothetical protein GY788_19295 [bacterium]|nr:hypothetical protein [bacterium]